MSARAWDRDFAISFQRKFSRDKSKKATFSTFVPSLEKSLEEAKDNPLLLENVGVDDFILAVLGLVIVVFASSVLAEELT